MKDSILCIVLRAVIFFMRFLPIEAWLCLGRGLGRFYYYFAFKQNRKSLCNLRIAFGGRSIKELKEIVRQMYMRFAQNLIETLYLPYVDEAYVAKYIRIKGFDYVQDALAKKRGIIFLAIHAGSWELSNAACALILKDSRYAMLAQPQSKHKKIDAFLNSLREMKGVQVIRVDALRKLVHHLSANNILGTIADHGGKDGGIAVEFFSKLAMTPTGSIKLARKLGSQIIIAFVHRCKGPYHEMIFSSYDLNDGAGDLTVDLKRVNKIFEEHVRCFPCEYLWFYKRWKHSPQQNILILSDKRLGHLKQSLSLAGFIGDIGLNVTTRVIDVKFKNKLFGKFLALFVFFLGRRLGGSFFSIFVTKETLAGLSSGSYDIVISTGSSVAALNLAVSFQKMARPFAVMKPDIFSVSRFDLVIALDHDRLPARKNVLALAGSLSSVNEKSMRDDFERLSGERQGLKDLAVSRVAKVGLLLGGSSKNYELTFEIVDFLCLQIKKFLEETGAFLCLTTSQRTGGKIVDILSAHFKKHPQCALFVDAARDNPSATVGAILYLSDVVIVSGESVSMVSEAAASGKYVIVFEPRRKVGANKVDRFLAFMAQKKYIYLTKFNEVYDKLQWIIRVKPERNVFDVESAVKDKLKQIL